MVLVVVDWYGPSHQQQGGPSDLSLSSSRFPAWAAWEVAWAARWAILSSVGASEGLRSAAMPLVAAVPTRWVVEDFPMPLVV